METIRRIQITRADVLKTETYKKATFVQRMFLKSGNNVRTIERTLNKVLLIGLETFRKNSNVSENNLNIIEELIYISENQDSGLPFEIKEKWQDKSNDVSITSILLIKHNYTYYNLVLKGEINKPFSAHIVELDYRYQSYNDSKNWINVYIGYLESYELTLAKINLMNEISNYFSYRQITTV